MSSGRWRLLQLRHKYGNCAIVKILIDTEDALGHEQENAGWPQLSAARLSLNACIYMCTLSV